MSENLDVLFQTEHISLRLVKDDDDQEITVQPVETVSLTISDRVVLSENFVGGGGGISGVIVEDEGVEVGTYTRLNFTGAQVAVSEEDEDTALIVIIGDGAGGSLFLPTATYYDDTDEAYFYFGWTAAQTGGEWLVRRSNRATLANQDAQQTGNPSYADLDAAWPNRASLTYS